MAFLFVLGEEHNFKMTSSTGARLDGRINVLSDAKNDYVIHWGSSWVNRYCRHAFDMSRKAVVPKFIATQSIEDMMTYFLEVGHYDFEARVEICKMFDLGLRGVGMHENSLLSEIFKVGNFGCNNWKIDLLRQQIKPLGLDDRVIYTDSFNYDIGFTVTNGQAGAHGSCGKCEVKNCIYVDVKSMFPSIICNYGLYASHHVNTEVYDDLVSKALSITDPSKKRPIKLLTNRYFGSMNCNYSPLYDMDRFKLVGRVSQIIMYDLSSELYENGVKIYQLNTDGIMFEDSCDWKKIVDKWTSKYHLSVKVKRLRKLIQRTVNDYMAICEDGEVITKGGLFSRTVPQSVSDGVAMYLLFGLDIELPDVDYTVEKTEKGYTYQPHRDLESICTDQLRRWGVVSYEFKRNTRQREKGSVGVRRDRTRNVSYAQN